MEVFALKIIEKKNRKAAQLLAEGREYDDVLVEKKLSQAEIDEINRREFGYPYPPSNCCSIGRPSSAAVWWTYPKEKTADIIGWEITRYRRDHKEWYDIK